MNPKKIEIFHLGFVESRIFSAGYLFFSREMLLLLQSSFLLGCYIVSDKKQRACFIECSLIWYICLLHYESEEFQNFPSGFGGVWVLFNWVLDPSRETFQIMLLTYLKTDSFEAKRQ